MRKAEKERRKDEQRCLSFLFFFFDDDTAKGNARMKSFCGTSGGVREYTDIEAAETAPGMMTICRSERTRTGSKPFY